MFQNARSNKLVAGMIAVTVGLGPIATPAFAATPAAQPTQKAAPAKSPIQHLVVIFQENVSFDHYFGTYPQATNPQGEPAVKAQSVTPTVNNLSTALQTRNPNLNPANGAGASNPYRLDRSQAATADQDHDYTAEQQAFDAGLMDLFPSTPARTAAW